jgi:hypothetical protein
MDMDVFVDQLLATAPLTPRQRTALGLAPHALYYPEIEKLRTNTDLEEFALNCDEDDVEEGWDVEVACRLIPAAILDNESITKITLKCMTCNHSVLLMNDFFLELANRPRNLEEISLCFGTSDLSESARLKAYLQSLTLGNSAPQARTLGTLHLVCEHMTAPLCQLLFGKPHRGKTIVVP